MATPKQRPTRPGPTRTAPSAKPLARRAAGAADLSRAMMDSAKTNIMFCDTDFVIRYVNPQTIRTLKKLQEYLPVRAEELVGQSIDIFHKRPEHQQRMLSEPGSLPPMTLIRVGPETLELRVSPVFDGNRQPLGTMVTWDVVTERVAMETKNSDYCVIQSRNWGWEFGWEAERLRRPRSLR